MPTFKTAYGTLKANRYMVININKKHRDIIVQAALSVGFKLEDELQLITGRDHFSKKHGINERNSEPILVFKKVFSQ